MNHFFYETRGRERVTELMKEGLGAQALHRCRAAKPSGPRALSKFTRVLLGVLAIVAGLLSQ
jgi:hypothetical protein